MDDDDKLLYEEAKKALNVDNLGDLAELIGYAKTTSNNWYKSGFSKIVRMKIREKLNQCSENTISGAHQVVKITNDEDENSISLNYYPDIVAAAGYGAINESSVHPQIMKFDRRFLTEFINVRRFDSIDIIRVIGDSMEPYIRDGETVLIERHSEARNGETVIANVNGHIYIKRFHTDPFGRWVKLISENNHYGDIELSGDDLECFSIVGIVRAKIKAF